MTSIGLPTAAERTLVDARTSGRRQRQIEALMVGVLVAADVAIVAGTFIAAYVVRFVVTDDLAAAFPLDLYVRTGVLIGFIAALLVALQGLSDLGQLRPWPTRLRAITSAVSTGAVIAVILSFDQDQRLSRAWLAIGWSLSIIGLSSWRSLAPALHLAVHRRLSTRPRLVVVGANPVGQELARELESRFDVLGYVDNGADLAAGLDRPMLAPIAELEAIVRSHGVDEIVIALPRERREQVDRIVARGFGREVDVKFLAEFTELLPHRLEVGRFGSHAYIGFAPVARVTWVKRAVDLALASCAVVAAAPILAGIAMAVKLDSSGPVLYRQRRLGKDSVPFEMLKFRSMCQDAEGMLTVLRDRNEATGPLFKIRRDPRVTRVGRVLRRFSLDELPQLFNVLRGEMSLVGPRPPLPDEVSKYEEWQIARLQALPGMTGLWQVSGRSEVPFNDMIRLDLHYVRNWSFGLDLEIMLRTIPAVLVNHGAY
jgi:exopolysaccharide biosynthesis polyprenyl glycosylphosphotransferase